MVELALLQSVSYIAGALGVCVAAIYYVMNLSEARKNRRMQFLLQIVRDFGVEDGWKRYVTLMNMEWKDYDDFEKKYGSDNNPDAYAMRVTAWSFYHNLGYMVYNKMVSAEEIFDLMGEGSLWAWQKWGDIIKELRIRYKQPFLFIYFDYLASELEKIRVERGASTVMPDTFLKYIPDK